MKTLAFVSLFTVAIPAASLACDEGAKDATHSCGHANSATAAALGDASATGEKVVIPIEGMHCGRCAERVSAALANIDGVKRVETSLDAKQTVVVYDRAKAKPEALVAAITDAGYRPGTPARQ